MSNSGTRKGKILFEGAPDIPKWRASEGEMHRQVGDLVLSADGIANAAAWSATLHARRSQDTATLSRFIAQKFRRKPRQPHGPYYRRPGGGGSGNQSVL
jgi:hypothetical protein